MLALSSESSLKHRIGKWTDSYLRGQDPGEPPSSSLSISDQPPHRLASIIGFYRRFGDSSSRHALGFVVDILFGLLRVSGTPELEASPELFDALTKSSRQENLLPVLELLSECLLSSRFHGLMGHYSREGPLC